MRTTVSLEPDVARQLEQRMAAEGKGFKQVLNETLRRGLAAEVRKTPPHYEVPTFDSPFEPGLDIAKINQFLDEEPPAARDPAP
jgi:hypothetical protein